MYELITNPVTGEQASRSISELSALLPDLPRSTWSGGVERMRELALAACLFREHPEVAASLIRREASFSRALTWADELFDQQVMEEQPKYDVVVVDPPRLADERPCQLDLNDCFPMDQERLQGLLLPMADDCHVWLWCPAFLLKSGIETLERWGCTFQSIHVWPAPSCDFADRPREADLALYGRRGNPALFDASRLSDSLPPRSSFGRRKPARFYEMVAKATLGQGRALCLSAQVAPGFDSSRLCQLSVRDAIRHFPSIAVPCDQDLGRRLSEVTERASARTLAFSDASP